MGSLGEIMKLCRLCLVKDQVNVPIFEGAGDIRKISQKIGACLPVKVTKDDKLPKKICNGCSHKLDMVYQFWNTTTSSEKQLLEWVNNPSSRPLEERGVVAEHIVLKQEVDNGDSEALDAGEFIDVNETFETIGFAHDDDDEMSNENIDIKTENDSRCDEPPIKKHKTVSLSSAESEEDADDPSDAYNRDDSDEDDNDVSEAQPAFVNVAEADQQPGPSGVGKASGEAPVAFIKSENEIEFVECNPAAKETLNHHLLLRSSAVYQNAYDKFIKWCKERDIYDYSENVLLTYFTELAMKWKSPTMWSQYSMIKSLLKTNNGVDISEFQNLRAHLSKENKGYKPKKSRSFTKEQFHKFLSDAPDEEYLDVKVIMIIGVFGGCRCDEMVKMKIDNIEDLGSSLLIKIPDSKTNDIRSFEVVGETFLKMYRKYISLRPKDMKEKRLFIKYKNGKCFRQVMGIHKIGSVPKEVASFLGLPCHTEYTGHCLRRTSASFSILRVAEMD